MVKPADRDSIFLAETESPQLVGAVFLHQLDLFFRISRFFRPRESPQFSSRIPQRRGLHCWITKSELFGIFQNWQSSPLSIGISFFC